MPSTGPSRTIAPGPGAYDQAALQRDGTKRTQPKHTFGTRTGDATPARRKGKDSPGPGMYDVSPSLSSSASLSHFKRAPAFSMGSPRHTPRVHESEHERGPGRYDVGDVTRVRKAPPAFSMGHKTAHQPDLVQQQRERTPGAGTHSPKLGASVSAASPAYSLGRPLDRPRSAPKSTGAETSPGPGAYFESPKGSIYGDVTSKGQRTMAHSSAAWAYKNKHASTSARLHPVEHVC